MRMVVFTQYIQIFPEILGNFWLPPPFGSLIDPSSRYDVPPAPPLGPLMGCGEIRKYAIPGNFWVPSFGSWAPFLTLGLGTIYPLQPPLVNPGTILGVMGAWARVALE